jgi:ribonuclease D
MSDQVMLVDTPAALATLVERVRSAPRVGLDTEFHNERSYTAHLMVIQLAFDDGVAIVDPLALRDLRPLIDALAETEIVGHALSSDLRILAEDYGKLPRGAYDTQVAAAFCGYGLTISLLDLVRDLAGVTLRKSQTVSDWSTRPFTDKQLDYLVDDVRYLFTLADKLDRKLEARGRAQWARDEMRGLVAVKHYTSDPQRLYLRVAGNARMSRRELGLLNSLAILRDRLARERNIPLKYVIPDDVLAGLVSLRPRSIEELSQLRRLDGSIKKHYGAAILEAIAIGEAIPEDDLPPKAPRPLGAQREALVATLALLVNAVSAENDVPSTLLLSRAALERVAREFPPSIDELERLLDVAAWRRSLIVEPLWELLTGERAIRITGYESGTPRTTFSRDMPGVAVESAG